MKSPYAKRYEAWKIAGIPGCCNHTLKHYIENGFDASPREQPPSALSAYGGFLRGLFLQHHGNADVVQ